MKNKKIWARIGAILACVLLVGALAVPCFADESQTATTAVEPPEPPPDGYTPPYGSAIDEFIATLDPRANNDAFATLLSIYNGYGDSRLFDAKTLVSGTMDILADGDYSAVIPVGYNMYFDSPTTVEWNSYLEVDNFVLSLYESDNSVPNSTFQFRGGRLDAMLYLDDDSCMMDITYTVSGGYSATFGFRYSGDYNNSSLMLDFESLIIDGDSYSSSDLYRLDMAFVVNNYSNMEFLPYFVSMFNSSAPYYYHQIVYSPYNFYQGFKKSYNLGYADAEMWAYQYGYEKGKIAGIEIGKQEGKQESVEDHEAYKQGYHAAVKDIDSGDFGRNFLGAGFSAPFQALKEFTLIEWTTENGTTFSVSLALLFSAIVGVCLFVWFLKMFAGG